MPETEKYPFAADFQTRILAVLLRDREFTLRYYSLLKPNHFDNGAYVDICKTIFHLIEKYGSLPSQETLLTKCKDLKNYPIIERILEKVYSLDLTDANVVEDEVKDFVQQQSWRLVQPQIDGAVRQKDFNKARELFDKYMRVEERTLHESGEIHYFENVEASLENLKPEFVHEDKIATFIKPIDDALRGGPSKGELHVLFAPKKTGKSIFLCNIAVAGLYQGKNVTFVSLELKKEKVEARIHTRITGIPDHRLYRDRKLAAGRIKRLQQLNSQLIIKKYPTKGATVGMLRSYLDYLWKVEGFVTDLLIVDYLDIMRYNGRMNHAWEAQGPISEELRGLAEEFDVPCWTVTQAKPIAESRESLELVGTDMAGSSEKAYTCDSMWALAQTTEEEFANPPRARLYCNYLRDGIKIAKEFPMKFDKKKMLLTELSGE